MHLAVSFWLVEKASSINWAFPDRENSLRRNSQASTWKHFWWPVKKFCACLVQLFIWLWIVGVVLDICHYRHSVSLFAWLKNLVDSSLSLKKLPIPKGVLFKLLFSLKIIFSAVCPSSPKSLSVDGCFKVTRVAFQDQEPKVRLWI